MHTYICIHGEPRLSDEHCTYTHDSMYKQHVNIYMYVNPRGLSIYVSIYLCMYIYTYIYVYTW